MNDKYIGKISEPLLPIYSRFGEKGLRLQKLKQLGFVVPDGLLLSVEFMQYLIRSMGLQGEIDKILEREAKRDANLEACVREILKGKVPEDAIRIPVEEAIRSISRSYSGPDRDSADVLFAVRSAALGEDDETTSFAGQYSTVLNVNLEHIWSAIFECYASWWTERAVSYRATHKMLNTEPRISIIVQLQLNPEYSGVLFTRHPFNPSENMVIEAVAGFGEKLVSGKATPARWEIDPRTKKIVDFQADPAGQAASLSKSHLDALIDIGQKAETAFGKGLDLEWAIEGDTLYILQLRPVSTLDRKPSCDSMAENFYSRSIVEDLWSDRMTDMTASIVFDELSDLYTFKAPLRKLKLHELSSIQAIRVINGYGYLNNLSIAKLLEFLPGFLRFREIQNVFPPSIREKVLQTPFQPLKVLRLLPRLPLLFSDPAILPFLTVPLLKRHIRKIEDELNRVDVDSYAEMTCTSLRNELERLLNLLAGLQVRNQWGYGNASIFTWILNHFATRYAGRSDAWVLKRMSHIPSNITLTIQEDLMKISRCFDEELRKVFLDTSEKENLWEILQTRYGDHPATRRIEKFIAAYRYRSANRDFIHPRWDEKPGLVLDLLTILLKTGSHAAEIEGKTAAEPNRSALPAFITVPILYVLLRSARSFLALREDLRFALDKVFYRIRKLLLAMSKNEAFRGLEAVRDGIFFLRLDELRNILDRKKSIREMLQVIQSRKEMYTEDREKSPPFYVFHDGEHTVDLCPVSASGKVFAGTAASPGMAEGKARVIRSESDFDKLQKGEILIAYNTDPGWTPLFVTTAGVAVEMGGILNHCAIVAREYGVPAVVGLQGITGKIEDGQLVRIDGNSGTLEILDRGNVSSLDG
jgi:pyruvate,water dikinase